MGAGESERQAISLTPISGSYKKFPLSFTAKTDSEDASVEITGTGGGNFHIGAISLMPADNVHGFRPDAIALLRQIKSGFWRFGGNYTSNYTWYDAIGDPDKRPPDWDYAWNQMQPNDLGPDELAEFCTLIGVAPYISVNAGLGDSHSAAEEVEYMNGASRHADGCNAREKWPPAALQGEVLEYRKRALGIVADRPHRHQIFHPETQRVCEGDAQGRPVDRPDRLRRDAGGRPGSGPVAHKVRRESRRRVRQRLRLDRRLPEGKLGNFDGMAEHWYARPGQRYNLEKAKNCRPMRLATTRSTRSRRPPSSSRAIPRDIVRSQGGRMAGIPAALSRDARKKTFLSIDEYAYFGGGFGRPTPLKTALAYAMTFNEMLRHTDFITMAAHTMGTSTLDFNRTASTLNTLGLVFKMYSNHFPGTIPGRA